MGFYATSEAFDRDLHHLFEIAKKFIKPDTPGKVYTDLLVLQVRSSSGPLFACTTDCSRPAATLPRAH